MNLLNRIQTLTDHGPVLRQDRRCYQHGNPGGGCSTPSIVAVAVDPSGGDRDTAGIVGGYLGLDGRLHLTHDQSGVMPSADWARAACELAELRTQLDAMTRERDEARAQYVDQLAATRKLDDVRMAEIAERERELGEVLRQNVAVATDMGKLIIEVRRMQPVVEVAKEWAAAQNLDGLAKHGKRLRDGVAAQEPTDNPTHTTTTNTPQTSAHDHARAIKHGTHLGGDVDEADGYQQAIDHVRNAYNHGYLGFLQQQTEAGHYTQWLNQAELTEVADFLTHIATRKDTT